ncbi:MAG: VWA domain-containing protein [Thermodesulfobacteriota bacterium]
MCKGEFPWLIDLWAKYKNHGVEVVMVQYDVTLPNTDFQNWLSTCGFTFPVAHDDPPAVLWKYVTPPLSWPQIFIIGRDMTIQKYVNGPTIADEATLENMLLDVLFVRDPVNLAMVMDVSDSMNSPSPSDPSGDSKLTMMKRACNIITDLLNDHGQIDDRVGLVWFTDDAGEYADPISGEKLVSVANSAAALKAEIDLHATGNCTALGAGLQTGFDTLATRPSDRFVILCTDGMQNIDPKVTPVGNHLEICDSGGWLCGAHAPVKPHPGVDITHHNTTIQTIGIGIEASYATLLQDTANATGGFYLGTNDPDIDLDLLYYVDLCNCMSGGSPAVVTHIAGRLHAAEKIAKVHFNLNRSVRKVTAILSWKRSQHVSMTFWLHDPKGKRIPLHGALRHHKSYALATLYLPIDPPEANEHVGRWRMVIAADMRGSYADYHAAVIAEDRDVKCRLDYPRKTYSVGDVLPIRIRVEEMQRPVPKITEIAVETAHLADPLPELISSYRASPFEIRRRIRELPEPPETPLLMKLAAMASDPGFRERLKPLRSVLSLQQGSLRPEFREREILLQFELKKTGLHTFKVITEAETEKNGPVQRTNVVSVLVDPGRIDPEHTAVVAMERSTGNSAGFLLRVTPRNGLGQLLGPGHAEDFEALIEQELVHVDVEDQLDGCYQVEILFPEQEWKRLKTEGKTPRLVFRKLRIWR